MGLKILHSADWHLDSPFRSFDPERRAYLKEEQRKIAHKVAAVCRREGCDLMLLGGDIFDGPCTKDTVETVKAALESCGVPVFISPGNHDFCGPDSPWLEERWPENVHVFAGDLESVVIPELDCRVYGAGYRSMDCPGLLEGFRAEGTERYCLCILHGDPVQLNSPYCPITAAQVRDSGLDYLALGHIHKGGSFLAGSTCCAWPGSPMGRGLDETGEKGVLVVEIHERVNTRFVPLQTPRFYDLTVDSGENAIAALTENLPAAGNLDFYRITLTGSGEGNVQELLERFPNLTIRDCREWERDIWASAGEDTLEGVFFSLLREQLESADEKTAKQIQLAAKISRKLLEGREVAL